MEDLVYERKKIQIISSMHLELFNVLKAIKLRKLLLKNNPLIYQTKPSEELQYAFVFGGSQISKKRCQPF
jgi:hypothetical protein